MALRVVFAGTPEFAVPSLRAAATRAEVVAVYTQPDRPAGRGRVLMPSPVKKEALLRGIPVFQPENMKSQITKDALRALKPDLMIVVAYGLILPKSVLQIPGGGCWNVHASMLPRWRGAAPIQRAIEAGDTRTGVCLMQMEAGLDTGPILLSNEIEIGPNETGGELHDRLAELGARTLSDALALTSMGMRLPSAVQATEGVSYAHKLDKTEARLDWQQNAETLANKVRAYNPWPMAEAMIADERVRIFSAAAVPRERDVVPGEIVQANRLGIDIACVEGALRIRILQREGGRMITAADFINARRDLQLPQAL